jgi:hypothetical protein
LAKQRPPPGERADKRDRQLARLILRTALPVNRRNVAIAVARSGGHRPTDAIVRSVALVADFLAGADVESGRRRPCIPAGRLDEARAVDDRCRPRSSLRDRAGGMRMFALAVWGEANCQPPQISTSSTFSVATYSTNGPRFAPSGSIAMYPLFRRRASRFLAVATSHSR